MLKRVLKDPIIYLLLAVNVGLALAYFKGIITAETILYTYFFQSLLIGISYFLQMMALRDFSVENMSVNNKPVEKTGKTKGCIGLFFLMHFGFFHLVYFIFLTSFLKINGKADWKFILSSLIAFAFGELMSVIRHKITFRSEKPNIGTMMATPYLRIIPMHFFILIGGFMGSHDDPKVFAIFIILKIISDVIMHIVVNKTYKERESNNQPPIINI